MVQISAVLLLVLLISGCATQQTSDVPVMHGSYPELESALTWVLQGKMGVKSNKGGANMSFVWKQRPDKFEIVLKGALGSGVANLSGTSRGVTLTLPGGEEYQSDNIDELLEIQLGYPFPVSQLYFWVRGLPDPQNKYQVNGAGFSQQGWLVTYNKFTSTGPEKIQIEREGIRLKLVKLQWQY